MINRLFVIIYIGLEFRIERMVIEIMVNGLVGLGKV